METTKNTAKKIAVPSIHPVERPSLATPMIKETIEATNKTLKVGSSKQFMICCNIEFSFSGGNLLFPHFCSLHLRSSSLVELSPRSKSVRNICPMCSTLFKCSLKYFWHIL